MLISETTPDVEATAGLVVSKNLVDAGIKGSFSSVEAFSYAMNRDTRIQIDDIHFRRCVSIIIKSTSQFPTPGPPRLERDGRTRFCRACFPGFVEVEGPSMLGG